MSSSARARFAPIVAALVSLSAPAHAQRVEAKFEWQKRAATFTYGVPRVGKHTLDELKVGETWRLGANEITTLTANAPLIAADTVVPPGIYRVNIARQAQDKFELTIEGAGARMAAGGDHVAIPATYADSKKPNEALELELEPVGEQPEPELRRLELTIQFGVPLLVVPMTIVGTQPLKAKGFTVDAFKLPEKWLKERLELAKHTPVATLARTGKVPDGTPARMNLLLAEEEAILLPTMKAPTADRGFGEIELPDRDWTFTGKVVWSVAQKSSPHFLVESVAVDKQGELMLVATVGMRRAEIRMATVRAKPQSP